MSRAMIASVLWLLEHKPAVDARSSFADVAADAWYTQPIQWANSIGIVQGYGDRFGINDPVTREQIAVMLWRLAGCPAAPDYNVNASPWAINAMNWAAATAVLRGGNATSPATRAEAAAMLMRFIQLQ